MLKRSEELQGAKAENYIQEAKDHYDTALKRLEESKRDGDESKAADACAKGWLAVILVTDMLFLKKGEKEENLPKTYRGRVFFLKKYGDRELRRIFDRSRNVLHIDGYYDRLIDYERIFESLDDVQEYIQKIEEI